MKASHLAGKTAGKTYLHDIKKQSPGVCIAMSWRLTVNSLEIGVQTPGLWHTIPRTLGCKLLGIEMRC